VQKTMKLALSLALGLVVDVLLAASDGAAVALLRAREGLENGLEGGSRCSARREEEGGSSDKSEPASEHCDWLSGSLRYDVGEGLRRKRSWLGEGRTGFCRERVWFGGPL